MRAERAELSGLFSVLRAELSMVYLGVIGCVKSRAVGLFRCNRLC